LTEAAKNKATYTSAGRRQLFDVFQGCIWMRLCIIIQNSEINSFVEIAKSSLFVLLFCYSYFYINSKVNSLVEIAERSLFVAELGVVSRGVTQGLNRSVR
jgi:hypothetical protein